MTNGDNAVTAGHSGDGQMLPRLVWRRDIMYCTNTVVISGLMVPVTQPARRNTPGDAKVTPGHPFAIAQTAGGNAGMGEYMELLRREHTIIDVGTVELIQALNHSTDLGESETMADFADLLIQKYMQCSDWFIADIQLMGIEEPLTVIVMPDGSWQFDDGHHRLAVAHVLGMNVPVVFDDSGAGENSVLCFEVARGDCELNYDTTAETAHREILV